ncbi:serine/threonine-protein kinase Chk2-like [Ptychodera flava]|uniref:serine/threonine-protein kinase Chk2-like n=1 Tax=Ptychodera flava TaxID=63121 RepID=UPI00396A1FDC
MSQSGHNTSSSLSSGGTISSMETLPTQDVVDGDLDDEIEEIQIWGRLFPLGNTFIPLDLTSDEYKFGRDSTSDYCFDNPPMKKNTHFQALSKNHFRLYKDTGDHVIIEDKSSNGTFLNGEKIGKNKKQVLNNNDEIALATKKNKAFVFMDNSDQGQENLPAEMKAKYKLSKVLGRGACGEVKLAFEKGTCKKLAVKIIQKKTFSIGGHVKKDLTASVKEEVKILKAIHHPCIIAIEDVYETDDMLYIILELVEGGELFDRVVSIGKFKEDDAKCIFYQMLIATKYLHDRGITHRDLKPENVLLTTESNDTLVKITDFGLSKFVGENSLMKTLCGTPTYLAPEVLTTAGMGGYGKAVDCWSLGVILFVILAGYPPFSEEVKEMKLHDQIVRGYYSFPPRYWQGVNTDAIDLIKKLMTVDPKKRFTTMQALSHPWMKDDTMIKKAQKLMYREAEDMPPPVAAPAHGKKRTRDQSTDSTDSEASNATKKASFEADETDGDSTVFAT